MARPSEKLTIDQKRLLLRDHAIEVIRLAVEIENEMGADLRRRTGTRTLIAATRTLLSRVGVEIGRGGDGDGAGREGQ